MDSIKKTLPKTYIRKHVLQEVELALTHFKDLKPAMEDYVYNDGKKKNLLNLKGIIPVTYKETTYNIPICVWLEENYPQSAPICYVKPTHNMMIVKQDFITSNGEVMLPYLEEWKQGECDLVSLLQVMVITFEDSPPVCMRPPPLPESSCWWQFLKAQIYSKSDGTFCLSLANEDSRPHLQDKETNC
ncbi:tumor susceptibility gene 101 protein isoform X1 [Synchiropus splendidus]|uniref:tumor susceptibility gene 101 protein isoform X1 n=2 Tax=Synchiropus splendidus TaxID=270530 RepID=UPI00237D93CE|nr:tumor susceptibility gene 101 protein isoform X1 [Synchiropus splendidus]